MKKRVLLLWVGLILVGCTAKATIPQTSGLQEVKLTMGYRPDVQFTPLYVMDAKGYDQEQGLEVEFQHLPETDAVQLVASGDLKFAIVSGEQVLLARAQGLPVVYVMAWWQDYPVAIAAPKALGLNGPADLSGLRIGIPGLFGASYIGFEALMKAVGLPGDAVQLDSIGYTQVEALSQGLEDAVVIYATNEPIQLEKLGIPVDVFRVADYVHLTSNGLITSERVIREDPETVRKMIAAFLAGLQETIADPEGAYAIALGYVDGLSEADQGVQREILDTSIEFWVGENPGFSRPEAWVNMQDVLLEMGLLAEPLDLVQAYSNEFIPEKTP